jgi:hypothetical protein
MQTQVSRSETGALRVLLEHDRKWPAKSYTCQIDRDDQRAWFTVTVQAPKLGPISVHLPHQDDGATPAYDGDYAVRWLDGNGNDIGGASTTFTIAQGDISLDR